MIGSPIRMKGYRPLEHYEHQSDKEISFEGETTAKRDDGEYL